jgi:hypothetical protein
MLSPTLGAQEVIAKVKVVKPEAVKTGAEAAATATSTSAIATPSAATATPSAATATPASATATPKSESRRLFACDLYRLKSNQQMVNVSRYRFYETHISAGKKFEHIFKQENWPNFYLKI